MRGLFATMAIVIAVALGVVVAARGGDDTEIETTVATTVAVDNDQQATSKPQAEPATATSTSAVATLPTPATSTTALAAPEHPVLIGAGDIASDNDLDTGTAALIDLHPFATVFTTGDHAYPDGTTEQFAMNYEPDWGRFKSRTRPSIGNHDDRVDGAAPYFDYFGSNAGTPGQGWYSYDLANWHIIVLNTECGDAGLADCDEQSTWLEADLAENARRCMLAYWHKPVFSSGRHDGYEPFRDEWQLLDAAGVDLVIAGHDHNYQRYARQNVDGEPDPNGIRQFVAGSGGASIYPQTASPPTLEEFYAGRGVLRLDLAGDGYEWSFLTVDGDYTDRGSETCTDA